MSALESRDRRPRFSLRRRGDERVTHIRDYQRWMDEFAKKQAQAHAVGAYPRFVEGDLALSDTFYEVTEHEGAQIVVADVNRNEGAGMRHAVVLKDGKIVCLETDRKEMSGSRDTHKWIETEPSERSKTLQDLLQGFKKAELFTRARPGKWLGYAVIPNEILSYSPYKNAKL